MARRRSYRLFCIAALLAGCAEQAQSPGKAAVKPAPAQAAPAAKPASAQTRLMMRLLRAVYGEGAQYFDDHAIVELADPAGEEVADYLLQPVAMRELSDGMVALVVNGEMTDQRGTALSAPVTPGLLSAYLLKRDGQGWTLERAFENIAELGSSGRIGTVQWLTLADDKPGFAVLNGGTWQGSTVVFLSLFDLTALEMRDLTGGIAQYSSNAGACREGGAGCWTVDSTWRFEKQPGSHYDDLVFRFEGVRERATLAGTARYRFNGSTYALVEGENIVPEI
jgi:hypothetical protein